MNLGQLVNDIGENPVKFPGNSGYFVTEAQLIRLRELAQLPPESPQLVADPFDKAIADLEAQLRAINIAHLTASSKERQSLDLERGRVTSQLAKAKKNVELRREL